MKDRISIAIAALGAGILLIAGYRASQKGKTPAPSSPPLLTAGGVGGVLVKDSTGAIIDLAVLG